VKFDEDKPLAKQEAMMRRVSDLGSPDHRGDRGAAAARQDGLGDVIRLPSEATQVACAR
jgi:hypothetical protein